MGVSTIWTEKYRPKVLDQVVGQKAVISKIKAFIKQRNIPHLLFAGPAGVGKSTVALIIAKTIFGDSWRNNFLELNASDERGIDVVRVKVKDFARTRAIGDVPFKIVFLDECDALTKEAQQALRRTMENFTSTCRFILAANYSSKIIDPIQSRCAVFRFRPLSKEELSGYVLGIADNEGLSVSPDALDALISVSEGDCRRVVNILQSCAAVSKEITPDLVFSLASVARPDEVKAVLTHALSGDFVKARDSLLKVLLNYGLSGVDFIKLVQKEVWNLDVSDKSKVFLIDRCGEFEFRMVEGSDEFVQLEALLAQFVLVGKNEKKE
ncbi:replication factor C small subunit [Candidatus Woesearchaeota archaeon]|nr:MAG: Replication factor C small subunit [Candidatus Woesearchaeota archaeon ex4484_78]RLE46622.1 MAG: replication factor C small subunit [Candidatus Woesearchaeota archaeon]